MNPARATRRALVLPIVTTFVACSSGHVPGSRTPGDIPVVAPGDAVAGVVLPAVHRASIGAVDVDATGRYLLAADQSGFVALHDLEWQGVLLSHRVGPGGEPRTYARMDEGANFALVAFTQDEDDADAVALWDIRRDRITVLPDDADSWISSVATNDAIDTIAVIVRGETSRVRVLDRNLGVRCSVSLSAYFDGEDTAQVVVSRDGSFVDVLGGEFGNAARLTVASCEIANVPSGQTLSQDAAVSARASIEGDVGEDQFLRLSGHEAAMPLSDLPTFGRGGEYSVRDLEVDPEHGGLFVATRDAVVEISDRGTDERCPGATELSRTARGDVLALGEVDFCDVARGNAFEAYVITTLPDGRLVVARQIEGQGDARMMFYDPSTGSFADPPAFLANADYGRTTFVDDGRFVAIRDENGRSYRFLDATTGRETGRIPATATEDGIDFVSQPLTVGDFVGFATGSETLLVVDPRDARIVRTIDALPNGYPEITGSFVRSGPDESSFVDAISGARTRVTGELSLIAGGLVSATTDRGSDVVDLGTGRRHAVRGTFLAYDEAQRDLATCVDGKVELVHLDDSLAEVGPAWSLGDCDDYARFVRIGGSTYARSHGTELELFARDEPTIVIRLVRSGDGLVVFATDPSGRVALLGGDPSRLRYRPAGDPRTAELRPLASDAAFEAEVRARLHGRATAHAR